MIAHSSPGDAAPETGSLDLPALGDKISALERWAARIERMQAERAGGDHEESEAGALPSVPALGPEAPPATRPVPPPQVALPRFSARGQDLEPAAGSTASAQPSGRQDERGRSTNDTYVSILQQAHAALLMAHHEAAARVQEARLESARRLARAQEEAQEIRAAADVAARRLVAAADELNELRIALAEREAEAVLAAARQQLERLMGGAASLQSPAPDRSEPSARAAVPAPPAESRPAPHAVLAEPWDTADTARETLPAVSEEERHALFPVHAAAPRQELPDEPLPPPLRLAPRSEGAGEFDLVAGPFVRFEGLTRFTQALRALPGVRAVTVRRFAKRMVHLRVNYRGGEPLAAIVERLHEFAPQVVRQDARHLELRLAEPVDAPTPVERKASSGSESGRGVA